MSKFPLSEGSLLRICQGGNVEKPVVQLLSTKKIAGTSSSERHRLLISDGRNSNSYGMLATQMNPLLHEGALSDFAIVRVLKHQCNNMQGKKVIILLELDVLQPGPDVGKKIGSPVPINPDGTLPADAVQDQNKPMNSNQPLKRAAGDDSSGGGGGRPATKKPSTSMTDSIFPIASLTPYQNKWAVKARVTHKSDIRRWSNSRGDGHLFSVDLIDESGEIRATAFKEQCDRFYNVVEVGKVYLLSNCSMKPANKQFSTLNNDYELTLRDNAEMVPCDDDEAPGIPTVTFNFTQLSQLTPEQKDAVIDVLAVCSRSSDVSTITSQKSGKELRKRDVSLVDKSLAEVTLTLWGSSAENFDGEGSPIVAVKGARVSDYNGVSLNTLSSSTIQVNPDLKEAFALKGWYESKGASASFNSLSVPRGAGGDMGSGSNVRTLGEVKVENLGVGNDRGEYYSTTATIVMIQKDKALYKACTQGGSEGKGCNKKVQDLGNGFYRCEKCNTEMDRFNWRLVLTFSLADCTDNQWVTCFQEEAEKMLEVDAQQLGTLQEDNPDRFNEVFQEALFQKFNFRLRCKADNYNDEQRVRHTVMSASKVDFASHNKRMISDLRGGQAETPKDVDEETYV